MAWTSSNGSRADFCPAQGADQPARDSASHHGPQAFLGSLSFFTPAWLIATAGLLHVSALITAAPSVANTPVMATLLTFSLLLLIVAATIKPDGKTAFPNTPAIQLIADADTVSRKRNVEDTGPATAAIVRRNPPPVRANVAPGVSHLKDLDPEARAWAELMARVSHELRTPLNAVIGFSELMQREAFGPLGSPRYQEYARHIRESGSALLKSAEDTLAITSALTDTSSQASPLCHSIPLKPLVDDAWRAIRTQAESRGIRLETTISPNLEVLGENIALRQILLNLMCGALDHVEDGGQLLVNATARNQRVELELGSTTCKHHAPAETLPLCVARTLLQLQDASMVVVPDTKNGWRVVTILDQAVQQDFFNTKQIKSAPARLTRAA